MDRHPDRGALSVPATAGAGRAWTRAELATDPLVVAPALLGSTLTHGPVTLRLTEVEAYRGADDPGSHGYRGPTPRTAVMFGPAGHLYVYLSYGVHWCANVVCGEDGTCAAVLLRAGEVVAGHEEVAARRAGIRPRDHARGPGRLTRSLGLDGSDDGAVLVGPGADPVLRHPEVPVDPDAVRTGPRVGVSGPGGDGQRHPWRYWLVGEPTVSAYRPGRPRRT